MCKQREYAKKCEGVHPLILRKNYPNPQKAWICPNGCNQIYSSPTYRGAQDHNDECFMLTSIVFFQEIC